jgi:hypothetical protein
MSPDVTPAMSVTTRATAATNGSHERDPFAFAQFGSLSRERRDRDNISDVGFDSFDIRPAPPLAVIRLMSAAWS